MSFISHKTWSNIRPHTLVIACSDGRSQENIDDFLQNHLGVSNYDRVYAPGGPGALASSGGDYLRSEQFRHECAFLMEAHQIEQVVLIFHGASGDGPPEAMCADYLRKMSNPTPAEANAQQQKDAEEILKHGFGWRPHLKVRTFRAEVQNDGEVRFVELL